MKWIVLISAVIAVIDASTATLASSTETIKKFLNLPFEVTGISFDFLKFEDCQEMRLACKEAKNRMDFYLQHRISEYLRSKAVIGIKKPLRLNTIQTFLPFEFKSICEAHRVGSFEEYLKIIGWQQGVNEEAVARRRAILSTINFN